MILKLWKLVNANNAINRASGLSQPCLLLHRSFKTLKVRLDDFDHPRVAFRLGFVTHSLDVFRPTGH
jgi:hypothetical protein